jgi:hypothetical protein
MGFFKSWAKAIAYPITRPAHEIKKSANLVAARLREARTQHQQKLDEAEAISGLLDKKSPTQKFHEMYEGLGWTEPELNQQLLASGRTRLAMLFTGIFGFFCLLILMWFIPRWLIVVLGPMAVIVLAGCVGLGLRYAWWELQIQERALSPFRAFVSRADLFQRLFAGTGRK